MRTGQVLTLVVCIAAFDHTAFGQIPAYAPVVVRAMNDPRANVQFGLPAHAVFASDTRPRINNARDIVFPYGLGLGLSSSGVWANGANVLAQFPASMPPRFASSQNGPISINDARRVVWYGSSGFGPSGVYSFDLSSNTAAYHGNQPGGAFSKFSVVVNNVNQVAMFDAPGGHTALARLDLSTNVGSAVTGLGNFSPGSPQLLDFNDRGQIAYLQETPSHGVTLLGTDNSRTYIANGSTLFPAVSLNNAGRAAFFQGTGSFIQLATSDGVTANIISKAGAGQVFSSFQTAIAPVINDAGNLAFMATPQGGTLGLYVSDGVSVERVFGLGDSVQTPFGPVNARFGSSLGFDMNAHGDLVVYTQLTDGNGFSAGDSVLLIQAVPAPGTATLGLLSLAIVGRRRRVGV